MTCKECKMRNMCITICTYMEIYLAEIEVSQREFPFSDENLIPMLEEYLKDNQASYLDRHSQFRPELRKRLKKLTKKQRKIIKLYFLEGLALPEIAHRLELDSSGVRKIFSRGLRRLRQPK